MPYLNQQLAVRLYGPFRVEWDDIPGLPDPTGTVRLGGDLEFPANSWVEVWAVAVQNMGAPAGLDSVTVTAYLAVGDGGAALGGVDGDVSTAWTLDQLDTDQTGEQTGDMVVETTPASTPQRILASVASFPAVAINPNPTTDPVALTHGKYDFYYRVTTVLE